MYKSIFAIFVFLVFLMLSLSVISAESDAVQDDMDITKVINIKVIWDDEGQTSCRPDSVTVRLLRDDIVVDSIILNESNSWNGTFKIRDNGNYKVEEANNLSLYSVSLTGDVDNGFIITNTIEQTPIKSSDDYNDEVMNNNISEENKVDNYSLEDDVEGVIGDGNDDSPNDGTQNITQDKNQTKDISPTSNVTSDDVVNEKQKIVKNEEESIKMNKDNVTENKLENTGLPIVILVLVLFVVVIIPLSYKKK